MRPAAPLALPGVLAEIAQATDTETALRALDEVGLAGLVARSVETLSGGEHARVHLARALAQLAP